MAVLRKEGTLADGGSGLLKNGYENGITAGDSKGRCGGHPGISGVCRGDFRRGRIGEVCRAGVPLSEIRRAALPDPGGHAVGKGLKVLRPGLHLGTAKKGRFEPSHALALTLHAADVLHTMDLPSDGREIRGYLNGGDVSGAGRKGLVFNHSGRIQYRLGKARGGIMKNHYPKGLRKRLY